MAAQAETHLQQMQAHLHREQHSEIKPFPRV